MVRVVGSDWGLRLRLFAGGSAARREGEQAFAVIEIGGLSQPASQFLSGNRKFAKSQRADF